MPELAAPVPVVLQRHHQAEGAGAWHLKATLLATEQAVPSSCVISLFLPQCGPTQPTPAAVPPAASSFFAGVAEGVVIVLVHGVAVLADHLETLLT
jgi:hypothetical protein